MDQNKLVELCLVRVCRVCLTDDGDMKSFFSITSDTSDDDSLLKKYEQISTTEISESDGLPQVICRNCEINLNSAFDFQQQCLRSIETLKKYIETSLLQENYKVEIAIQAEEIQTEEPFELESNNLDKSKEDDVVFEEIQNDNFNESIVVDTNNKNEKLDSNTITNVIVAQTRKNIHQKRDCRLCGFVATNAKGLSLHISHIHKELKDRWCGVCYQEVEDLSNHVKTHAKIRSYICTFCDKGFKSHGHLTEHIRSHSNDKPFVCKECGKGFLSARHLRVHERIHTGEKPYICPHCGKCFTQNGTLQGHIRTHTGQKPYECDICLKKCTTSSALSIHKIKSGHVSKSTNQDNSKTTTRKSVEKIEFIQIFKEENNIEDVDDPLGLKVADPKKLCNYCGKTCASASKLRIHMRIHTGETPYKCTFCDKRFSTRGQMIVHVRTHTGEKPHVCHVCGKGFAQSSVLNTHMKLHTGRTEVCHVCQQAFCRPAELKTHMRKHTGEKPFLCQECGQSFIQSSHLTEHVKTHSDERPYKCQYCERGFKQSSSLKSHVKIHTGQKPFQCSQCPYSCRQSYALTQHMRIHINDTPQPDRPHKCIICHRSFTTLAMMTSHARTVHNVLF